MAGLLGTWGATGWTLAQHPFAQPLIARGGAEVQAAVRRAVARQASPDWLAAEVARALARDDRVDLDLLLGIADAQGLALPPDLDAAARAALGEGQGLVAGGIGCATCAIDITACATLGQIAACALPFEMTPFGDVNALRRNGLAWAQDAEVDELETGLAVLGLAATGAIVVSGGGSAPVKAGASLVRAARRMGALSPSLARGLGEAMTGLVLWDRLPAVLRGAPAETALDAGKAARLSALAGDVGRLREATSTAETLLLLRHADSADDLARLARLAEATGPETRAALRVLGPARAFRLLDRLSGLVLGAVGLIGLAMAQLGSLAGAGLARRVLAPRRPHRDSALASGPPHRR